LGLITKARGKVRHGSNSRVVEASLKPNLTERGIPLSDPRSEV
jgi:hypothetical protein